MRGSHALEPLHLAFSSAGRLMRILGSVVAPSTPLVALRDPQFTGCSPIRSEIIRDEPVWDKAVFLQKLAHEFQRRPFVPFCLDQHVEDLALGIHGAPKIDHAAIDFQIDLVQMPSRGASVGVCAGPLRSLVRNGSPSAEQFRRRRRRRVPPINLRRRESSG